MSADFKKPNHPYGSEINDIDKSFEKSSIYSYTNEMLRERFY